MTPGSDPQAESIPFATLALAASLYEGSDRVNFINNDIAVSLGRVSLAVPDYVTHGIWKEHKSEEERDWALLDALRVEWKSIGAGTPIIRVDLHGSPQPHHAVVTYLDSFRAPLG